MKRVFQQREGVVLIFAAPFLLFPTVFIPGTAVALTVLAAFWLFESIVKRRPWPVSPLNGPLLLLGLGLLVGALVSAEPALTLPKTTGLLLGLAALRFLTASQDNHERLHWGMAAFSIVGLAVLLIGTISVNWRFEVPLVEALVSRFPPRLITLPEGPIIGVHMNQLAGALLPYPLVLLSLLFSWRPTRQPKLIRIGLILLTLCLLTLLLLTQSRSGWLGLVMGLGGLTIMTFWWRFPKSRPWLVGGGLALSTILLVGAIWYIQSDNWTQLWRQPPQNTAVGDLSTLDFRREVWHWGVTAVEEFPLTGVGLGTYRRVAASRYPLAVPADFDIAHAHNIFLQVALDTGLPGLVGYVGLLAVTGLIGWRAAGKNVHYRPIILGLLAGLIALHAYGLGDALALGSKPAVIFWLMLGIIARLGHK
jgi:putative inorganic carbon (HCO3(-)) transporter